MVASASAPLAYERYQRPDYLFIRQSIAALIGFALLLGLMRWDYHRLFEGDGVLLLAALGLILLTFIPVLAPRRLWLQLGVISFQPTELMKPALIVYLAAALVRKERAGELGSFTTGVLPFFVLLGLLALVALAQPDFALVVVFGAVVVFMLWIGGVRLGYLLGPLAAGLPVLMGLLWLAPYRRARLLAYLDPFADPQGSGYHLIQSLIAFGSGGLFGRGLGASREKWLYLPSAYNDFIWAIVGEELGLIGAILVLGLFVGLAWRGFRIALGAPDRFGFLLGAGITFLLSFQAAIHFGVTVGALPITGLTLPLVSYGGSSLIVSLAMIGVLLNISRYSTQTSAKGESVERLDRRWGNGRPRLPRFGPYRRTPPPIWPKASNRLYRHPTRLGSPSLAPASRA